MRRRLLLTTRDRRLCLEALEHWGCQRQQGKLLEELGELVAALARYEVAPSPERHEHVVEELADALVMVHQMALIFGEEDVEAARCLKLARLEARLDGKDPDDGTRDDGPAELRAATRGE